MSEHTPTPVEAAHALTQAGIEHLRQLQARHAAETAAADQQRAQHEAELAEAQRLFGEAEAEERRLQQIEAARVPFEEALAAYQPLAAEADRLIGKLDQVVAVATTAITDALLAERARDEAGKPLTAAHARYASLTDAPHCDVPALRLYKVDRQTAIGILTIAAMLTDPRLADQKEAAATFLDPKPRPAVPNLVINKRISAEVY